MYEVIPYWIIGYYAGTSLVGGYMRMAWFGSLYLLAFFLILISWKRILPSLLKEPLAPLLIILSGVSFLWSVTPEITLASFRSLIVQYILVTYIVTTYTFDKIIEFIAKTFSFLGLLCFFNLFLQGGTIALAWRGIFPHQSNTAVSMAIALISLLYFFLINNGWKKGKFFAFSTITTGLICLVILLTCGAKTSLLGLLASFSIFPLFYLPRIEKVIVRTSSFIFLIYGLFGIAFLFYVVREFIITDVLGKSLTLTGRDTTWNFILDKFWQRPFQGYGLDAFWHNAQIAQEFSDLVNRRIPSIYNSHSGYYDLLIGLGIAGFFLVCLLLLSVYKRTIKIVISTGDIRARWCLQILILLTIAAYSDAFIGLLKPRAIGWLLFSIISLKTISILKETTNQPKLAAPSQYLCPNPYLNKLDSQPLSRLNEK